jgi:amino acid transporter
MEQLQHGNREDEKRVGEGKSELPHVEDDPALLTRTEVRHGKFPGQERIRIIRPGNTAFQRVGTGVLKATEESLKPQSSSERVLYALKRFFIGMPLASSQAEHERLPKFKALAVLSSDVISSVAYATEAILLSLVAAGSGNLGLTLPISFAIVLLLAVVTLSYRQTIPAYPNGGGSYIVAKDNLGTLAGLVAAASLLIDYVLTVSVSVASGVQNLASLFTSLSPYVVPIDVALVVFITIVNLRGVRESGSVFAIPTYIFIGSALLLIVTGLFKLYVLHVPLAHAHFAFAPATEPLTLFLILKSFAAGCSAMTGTEAISNGIPVFRKPEPRNASITLVWMAVILGTLFIGITTLALGYHVEANAAGNPTVIAQIASQVFTGPLYFMFPVFQLATLFILTLAANTSYADFPRLSSLLARDHFLPHQFAFRGDRLAFSTGILFLAVLASVLLIVFKGDTTQLINLYAVGVFMSFTLSQGGMVLHWWRLRKSHPGWQRSMIFNGLGAFTTLGVALIISSTKFLEGAWIVVFLIPLLVLMFLGIHRHYMRVERERTTNIPQVPTQIRHLFIVPIAGMDAVSLQSLSYARSITPNVIAVHVAVDEGDAERVQAEWNHWKHNIASDEKTELVIIESPYRSLTRPLLYYIDTLHKLYPEYTLTVLLPEFVVSHWWEYPLHNQTAFRLKAALLFRPGIVVTNVPQHILQRA